MCDVCKAEGLDYKFMNGKRSQLVKVNLHKVFVGRVARVQLCRVHDIQLFTQGEQQFLIDHIDLARSIVEKKSEFAG
jgi:hypothetical protein